MTNREEHDEYVLHTMAVIAARKAAGFEPPTDPGDQWWEEGPHIEKDGRSYYVHAMGCLHSNLGQAMLEHPDWYLVVAVVSGRDVKLHGLADPVITLAEIEAGGDALTADDMRLALELTPHEKREMWGVSSPEP